LNALQIMRTGPVIPVIVIERAEDAVPLAQALVAGGVRRAGSDAAHAGRAGGDRGHRARGRGAIVGVGTITRTTDFAAALAAGARFGVSPGLTPELAAARAAAACRCCRRDDARRT